MRQVSCRIYHFLLKTLQEVPFFYFQNSCFSSCWVISDIFYYGKEEPLGKLQTEAITFLYSHDYLPFSVFFAINPPNVIEIFHEVLVLTTM